MYLIAGAPGELKECLCLTADHGRFNSDPEDSPTAPHLWAAIKLNSELLTKYSHAASVEVH